eukprot:SM000010S04292  [mRNA]  locus=s10:691177:696450:- [translate_table: standard]
MAGQPALATQQALPLGGGTDPGALAAAQGAWSGRRSLLLLRCGAVADSVAQPVAPDSVARPSSQVLAYLTPPWRSRRAAGRRLPTPASPLLPAPARGLASSVAATGSKAATAGSTPEAIPFLGDTLAFPALIASGQAGGRGRAKPSALASNASRSNVAGSQSSDDSQSKLRKGQLVEFERDSTRVSLGVLQKPDGRRNWITADQFGNSFSVKPSQMTFVIPGTLEYTEKDIAHFNDQVQALLDPTLLELAWEELVNKKPVVQAEELAELLFMGNGPVECYSAHRLLATDRIYFRKKRMDKEGIVSFEPRPPVEELRLEVKAKEAQEKDLEAFVTAARTAIHLRGAQKPPASSWRENEAHWQRLEAIKAYSLDLLSSDGQKKLAEASLEALGVARQQSAALELQIRMGLVPYHINSSLLRSSLPQTFAPAVETATAGCLHKLDPDEGLRVDLSDFKIYTIDSEDTEEIDDGLSIQRLEDGRLRVWIHVADPARFVVPNDMLDLEARHRSTSVYLATGVLPMFPMHLASGPMSLRQGSSCCAMSVSATLDHDGSLIQWEVLNSKVKPTYRLSYEDVEEILALDVEEEPELSLLAEAARIRRSWRLSQGAIELHMPEVEIKVENADEDHPPVKIVLNDNVSMARMLVSELMILCGSAIAEYGRQRGLPLPYRGQQQPKLPDDIDLEGVPDGPCKSVLLRSCMTKSEVTAKGPIVHSSLGLPGYVQFSSPIRRYGDLLAHYQLKAVLRGEEPPFGAEELDSMMASVAIRGKEARRQEQACFRYWLIEHLKRQPRERVYRATVLRWLRNEDTLAGVLLEEVGYETVVRLTSSKPRLGDSVDLIVVEAEPRQDILRLQEASPFQTSTGRMHANPSSTFPAAEEHKIAEVLAASDCKKQVANEHLYSLKKFDL